MKSNRKSKGWIITTKAGRRYHVLRKEGKKDIFAHRYLMEQTLGRLLTKDEVIHHINGNGLDNRLKNLKLMTNGQHDRIRELRHLQQKPSRVVIGETISIQRLTPSRRDRYFLGIRCSICHKKVWISKYGPPPSTYCRPCSSRRSAVIARKYWRPPPRLTTWSKRFNCCIICAQTSHPHM